MWLSTVEMVISVLARGFPKEDRKRQSAHWASYLSFGLSFYYVPIGCVSIAINPEGPIMRLWPG